MASKETTDAQRSYKETLAVRSDARAIVTAIGDGSYEAGLATLKRTLRAREFEDIREHNTER